MAKFSVMGAIEAVVQAIKDFIDFFLELPGKILGAMKDMGDEIIDGILAWGDDIIDAIADIFGL